MIMRGVSVVRLTLKSKPNGHFFHFFLNNKGQPQPGVRKKNQIAVLKISQQNRVLLNSLKAPH